MEFSSFGLAPALLRAVTERNWSAPSPIQAAAIPVILQGSDLIASAQTGSGKTAAFCLPILQKLIQQTLPTALSPQISQQISSQLPPQKSRAGTGARSAKSISVLILVPTRELATQVGETLRTLAHYSATPIKLAVLFGGVSINPQMLHLRGGADIVIATPGRLLDLLQKNALSLSQVSTLVLDEADRLLELGFADELAQLLALLPAQRQHLLFSATFPAQLDALTRSLFRADAPAPVRLEIAATPITRPAILQRAIMVDTSRRTPLLRHLMETQKWDRVLVFAASRYTAELVAVKLRKARISAEPFHGELTQGKRTQVLADFKAGRVSVVVATDVASRGLDIHDLPVVLNYDLPRSGDDYTHRIGRTGRAGATGLAISFIATGNEAHFRLIENRHGFTLEREQIPGFETSDISGNTQADDGTGDSGNSGATGGMEDTTTAGTIHTETAGRHDPINGGVKGKKPNKKDKLRAIGRTG